MMGCNKGQAGATQPRCSGPAHECRVPQASVGGRGPLIARLVRPREYSKDAPGVSHGRGRFLGSTGKAGRKSIDLFHLQRRLVDLPEVTSRGIKASRPFVGNGMWVMSLFDPDVTG
jgi:hypothetical protein